jgi:hypothetical protein
VRGYTSFTQTRGDEAAAQLAARFAALARETVAGIGGEVVELRGDEALCVFPSARQSLRAAVAMQVRFRDRIDDEPVFPLGVGIGVAAGEAVQVEGGYRGGALNLAARLCSLASGGQILASETVTSLAGRLEGVRFVERRRTKVKGFEAPVRVIEVIPELELPSVPQPDRPKGRARRRRLSLVAAAVAVLTCAAVAVVLTRHGGGVAEATSPTVIPDSLAVVDRVLDGSRRVLLKIDPAYDEPTRRIPLPGAPSLPVTNQRLSSLNVSFGAGALWVTDGSNHLFRVDPASGRVATLDVRQPLDDVVVDARQARPRRREPNPHRQSSRHDGAVSRGCHGRRRGRLGRERQHPDGQQDRPSVRQRRRHDFARHRAQSE